MRHALEQLYQYHFGAAPLSVTPLQAHASGRSLFRLSGAERSVIGCYFPSLIENRAFIAFSRTFRAAGIRVPEIFAVSADQQCYLEEDLGNETLFDRLMHTRSETDPFPAAVESLYREALAGLSQMQIEAGTHIDYSLCTEGAHFDRAAMVKDTSYCKVEFLNRIGVRYDNQRLDTEFDALVSYVEKVPSNFFMFRDFQSRNVMIKDERTFFIDYQSGRRGALQYDIASMLFQVQARVPDEARRRLLDFYIDNLHGRYAVNRAEFTEQFYAFVMMRLIQVLGAYGKLGLGQRKEYFLKGVPQLVQVVRSVLGDHAFSIQMPEFLAVLNGLSL